MKRKAMDGTCTVGPCSSKPFRKHPENGSKNDQRSEVASKGVMSKKGGSLQMAGEVDEGRVW